MPTADIVSRVLWLSQLSPACDLGAVKQIWHASRQANARLRLTGAMVFDGERFCEMLEGDAPAIEAACRDLDADLRHVGMRRLYMSVSPGPRLWTNWRSGYCDATELDRFCGEGAVQAEALVPAFIDMLSRCDLLA